MKAVKRPISSKISSNNPSFHIEAHDSDVLVVSYHSTAPYSVVLFDLGSLINPVQKFFRVLTDYAVRMCVLDGVQMFQSLSDCVEGQCSKKRIPSEI